MTPASKRAPAARDPDAAGPAIRRLLHLLSIPTAPFLEEIVAAEVYREAAEMGLSCRADAAGNLWVRYRRNRPRSRWVLTAHLDHPGFEEMRTRGRLVSALFRGSVPMECMRGARVRFGGPCGAAGVITSAREAPARHGREARVRLDSACPMAPGRVGQWDLPSPRRRGFGIEAVACDDLVGVASVLETLREITAARATADVTALFTRAEEAGFIGAMAAVRTGGLARDQWILSIESSRAQPQAEHGCGVVVRVGDSLRVFDAALTMHLGHVAGNLARRDAGFRFARALMPGGVCESSVFGLAGLRAGALCVPLGNYHNVGPGLRIASERIDVRDYLSLVKLLAAVVAWPETPVETEHKIRRRLDERYRRLCGRLRLFRPKMTRQCA